MIWGNLTNESNTVLRSASTPDEKERGKVIMQITYSTIPLM